MIRPDRLTWYASLAYAAAKRGTCTRLQVGAILIIDDSVCGVSYNGASRGEPHCSEVGCIVDEERFGPHCLRSAHAEMNLVLGAARQGLATDGATVVVTHYPCPMCLKAMARAGIRRVYFLEDYGEVDSIRTRKGLPELHRIYS